MVFIAPIVEGAGEVQAVPVLLRRIAELENAGFVKVNPPIPIKLNKFIRDSAYFEKYIQLASAKAKQDYGIVLIMLDCDDDCPADLGPKIYAKAKTIRPDIEFTVSLAYREYETWFLCGLETLAGKFGLPADLNPPNHPETIRGAKEWLGQRMDEPYDPVMHQARFTNGFDIDAARHRSHSFHRFYNKISTLLRG